MTGAAQMQAALFDLDGTLVDTAPDMANALNRVLAGEGRSPLPYDSIRPYVSHGALRLVRVGFGEALTDDEEERLRQLFLAAYSEGVCVDSALFSGFHEVLERLERASIPWGVVTNKPSWLTEPLLKALDLFDRAECVVSADTVAERKPHPMPLLHAAEQIRIPPQRCLYVGDAERDIQAGRAAGMTTVIAAYGYLTEEENPDDWNAHGTIEQPGGVLDWFSEARTDGV